MGFRITLGSYKPVLTKCSEGLDCTLLLSYSYKAFIVILSVQPTLTPSDQFSKIFKGGPQVFYKSLIALRSLTLRTPSVSSGTL